MALTRAVEPRLLDDPSTEYGFLLHDVGKIGIPDRILQKPKPLSAAEERLMRTHTVLGEQVLSGVAFFHGEGLRIVRSHHERWDGGGYPDGLTGTDIPMAARIFAVADSLDAITSDRPYRKARRWVDAGRELVQQSGKQFDPQVVRAFVEHEGQLRAVRERVEAA
jgi:ribonuclease P protein subunit RPR2